MGWRKEIWGETKSCNNILMNLKECWNKINIKLVSLIKVKNKTYLYKPLLTLYRLFTGMKSWWLLDLCIDKRWALGKRAIQCIYTCDEDQKSHTHTHFFSFSYFALFYYFYSFFWLSLVCICLYYCSQNLQYNYI